MGDGKKTGSVEVFGGSFWVFGWLFTIGFAKLTFWKAVLALAIWPYYLGSAVG